MKKKLLFLTFFISIFLLGYSTENTANTTQLYKFKKVEGKTPIYSKEPITLNTKSNTSNVTIVKNYTAPKEMFRTTWVASVENMNFPKATMVNGKKVIRNSIEELKADWIDILDTHEKMNFNAVIYQVSPTLDAVYKSKNRPWSHVLTGKQGVEPQWADDFDLLKWMITETHKRGMEFHAWFNPYRVTHVGPKNTTLKAELNKLSKDNFARKNPDLVYMFDNKLYLNPGENRVIKHITDTISEFLSLYDVDAIHFDDYFYPYKSQRNGKDWYFGDDLEDRKTFAKNPRGFNYISNLNSSKNREVYDINVKNWRRNNINLLVFSVKSTIDKFNKANQRSVQWGISPFGMWDHEDNNPAGSKTPLKSTSSYKDIYADTRKWVKDETIDYIIPQIYWEFDQSAAPYGELVHWWSKQMNSTRTQLYIGHSSYKHLFIGKNNNWKNFEEIPNQMKFNQKYPSIKGSVFFGYKDIVSDYTKTDLGTTTRNKHISLLKDKYFNTKALVPAKPWLDKIKTQNVKNIQVGKNSIEYSLIFSDSLSNDSRFYVVYTFNNKNFDSSNPKNILKVVGRDYSQEKQVIRINKDDLESKEYVGISIKDRAGVETPVQVIHLKK